VDVLVTGGTGFVGACTVARLLDAGHRVRLLVRRPEQVETSLRPWGHGRDDLAGVVTGDVRDETAVGAALDGCDAVVHAAAIFSFDPRHAQEVLATNERAAEVVLAAACAQGLDPVVHVSSTVALTRHGGSDPSLPLGDIRRPYTRSKMAGEVAARRLQDAGHPVVSVYPGAVLGPHDPYRGENSERLRWIARGTFPLYATGGLHTVDVRTVADVVAAVLLPGQGARRYVVPGEHVDARRYFTTLAQVQGRRRPYLTMPRAVAVATTVPVNLVQRWLPGRAHYPVDVEAIEVLARDTRFDDTPARTELGVQPVPFEQSLRDTLAWLVGAGRLSPRFAPREPAPV
jgi:nucleoside-diphosphate-sugar epimerase